MAALYNTLLIALVSAILATIIGTAASIGINAMKAKGKTIMMGITNIPILNSEIVTGISLMLLFIACRVTLGFSTILLAHITFCIPYVILSVMPKLKQTSKSTYEAAQDLGAGPVYAFFKVVFPDIWPGVVSGFLMAFTMSLDDFIITHFTKGPGVDTLSTKIYAEVRKGSYDLCKRQPKRVQGCEKILQKNGFSPDFPLCRTCCFNYSFNCRRNFLQYKHSEKSFRRKGYCL